MNERIYQTEYAGRAVRYRFLTPGARAWFGPWAYRVDCEDCDVYVTPERLQLARDLLQQDLQRRSLPDPGYSDQYVEFRTLTELSAHPLIRTGCCFFHAASFLWRGRAWLLSGPSGVGKSTQFLNWQRLHPGEVSVICGDMPVLERREDGIVWVWPSPWNGKERLGDRHSPSAPLGGLVLLEQGAENTIVPINAHEAIPALFRQFILSPDTEQEILELASLMDSLLRSAPVWKLTNRGDDDSTELLRQTLKGGFHDPL